MCPVALSSFEKRYSFLNFLTNVNGLPSLNVLKLIWINEIFFRLLKSKSKLSSEKNSIPKDKFKEISSVSKSLVSSAKPIIKDMVNTTFDELVPQLNGGLKNLYKKDYG